MTDPADQVSITLASTDDIPHILAMIKELAAHEHALDSVEATETSLLHTLTFAPSTTSGHTPHTNPGYAKTLILRLPTNPTPNQTPAHAGDEPGAIAGMALFFPNYSTWRSRPGLYLERPLRAARLPRTGVRRLAHPLAGAGGAADGGRQIGVELFKVERGVVEVL
ncbi:Peroxygenase 1 [Friedmanniomyces endolithicus]|nr:Peroxygenase 1 [Friedmanniomyces endolithicus]